MRRRNSTDRTGRSKKAARHVRLYHWMMQTAAWRSLNANQRAIYVEMASRYNGSNNGRIHFSTREAAKAIHIGRATAGRELAVLVERGFIVAVTRGGFNVKDKQRQSTEWRLTEFNCDKTGALPSKDFARWSPESISRSHYRATNGPEVRPIRT
jgi:DNA-binding transcriptional MocR family regulator